ncbi:IclR family transcriptional regulator [Nonomuraea sp. NPDC050663]|uniref:IclR family transcriptional regulator n=1 Tax=Nonomuraea sp. NPDC050663 TaxID=3364370 RepID=UPI0037ABE781
MARTLSVHEDVSTQAQPSSLEKGVEILRALAGNAHPVGVAHVSRQTGLPKSTVHRLLGMLCGQRLARRVGTDYTLDQELSELTGALRTRVPGTRRVVLPHLLRLYETTRQTVNLAVGQGLEAGYIERLYGCDRVESPSDGVDRAPLHCTAAGKVLLAFDPELRRAFFSHGVLERFTRRTITRLSALEQELAVVHRRGVAYSREEFSGGVSCAAAPVFGPDGRICMAVGVAGQANESRLAEHGPAVLRVALATTTALRARRGAPA